MDEIQFSEFKLPEELLAKLYELTGSGNSFKGFILAYCNEDGTPVIYTSTDSAITESGLIKCLQDYADQSKEQLTFQD